MDSNNVAHPSENTEPQLVLGSDSSSEDESRGDSNSISLPPSLYVQGNINVYMQVNSATKITTLTNNTVQVSQPEVNYNALFQDLQRFWKQRATFRRRRLDAHKQEDIGNETERFYIRLELEDRYRETHIPVELADLFTCGDSANATSGAKIFIQGNPGFGKTTLSNKIYEDWGQDVDYVKEFELAIFIQLRHLSKENFREYFKHALIPQEKRDQGDNYWEALAEYQEKTLFILDGYDEVPKSLKTEVDLLMTGSLFGRSTVVLTSRFLPSNAELVHNSTKNVTILGFGEEEMVAFASRALPESLAENFCAIVNDNDVCYQLARCPLACNMLCQLFKSQNGTIPSNYTLLYTGMLKLQMQRAKLRNKGQADTSDEESSNNDASDEEIDPNVVFGPHDPLLQKLGKLSWDCLLKTRFIFKRKRLRTTLGDDYRQLVDLTVLYKEHELDSQAERSAATYVFAHRTFQEFLAAFYLTKHVTSSQELAFYLRKLIDSHIDSLTMMLRFMAGLLGPKAGLLFRVYHTSRIHRDLAYELYKEISENPNMVRELASQLHYSLDCREEDRGWLHNLVLSETSAVKEMSFAIPPNKPDKNWSLEAFLGGDFPSFIQVSAITVNSDSHSNLGQLRLQPQSEKVDLLNLQLGLISTDESPFDDRHLCRVLQLLNRHTRLQRLAGITLLDAAPDDIQLFSESLAALCSLNGTLESLELRFEGTWKYTPEMWDFVVSALSRCLSLKEISIIDDISFVGLDNIQLIDLPREALLSALVELSRTTNLRKLAWREGWKNRMELITDVLAERDWGNLTHLTLNCHLTLVPYDGPDLIKSLANTKLTFLALEWWSVSLNVNEVVKVLDSLKCSELCELRLVRCKFEITYPSTIAGDFQFPPEGSVLPKLTHLFLEETTFGAWPAHGRHEDEFRVVNQPLDAASFRELVRFPSSLVKYDKLTSLHLDVTRALLQDAFSKDLFQRVYAVSSHAMPEVTSDYVYEALRLTKIVEVKLSVELLGAESESEFLLLVEQILRGLPYLQKLGIQGVPEIKSAKTIANLLRTFWKGKELRLDLSRSMFGVSYNFIHVLVHDLQYGNEDDKQNFEVKYLGIIERSESSFLVQQKPQYV